MQTICIVGGGFSGVALARQLLNTLQEPTSIVLVNKEGRLGHGLAYGTPSPHHLLNVPAGRMGVDPDDETGFLRYLQGLGLPFGSGDFVPRSLYGAYLEHALGEARARGGANGVGLHIRTASALNVEGDQKKGFLVILDDATQIRADTLVLALGNFAASTPLVQEGLTWREPGLFMSPSDLNHVSIIDSGAPVLLLGSGLTAFDALLQLRHLGHRGHVTMLSRRGLLAQGHRRHDHAPARGLVPDNVLQGCNNVREMLHDIRARVAQAQRDGHDWRDVIGGLRESTPRLWGQLPTRERARFLRHLTPYWDTHRHRAAITIAKLIESEIDAGRLTVLAGRLRSLRQSSGQWTAAVVPRGQSDTKELPAAIVVNCTGPSSNVRGSKDRLMQALLCNGRLLPDPMELGLRVDENYRLLDTQGLAQDGFHYLGPMLKAEYWEAIAVPELRRHSQKLASILVTNLKAAN